MTHLCYNALKANGMGGEPVESFKDSEKQLAFDKIASCYYAQNFGSVGKADFDLLMFHIFHKHLSSIGAPTDDYSISKSLGITQQRIRNYKIKEHLRYGEEENADWKIELMKEALHHPHYSTDDQFITLSFDNPNVLIEVQHYIEAKGGFVDFSFNPKLLKMRTLDFVRLIVEIGNEKNEEDVWKLLRSTYRIETEGNEIITKDTFGEALKKGGLSLGKTIIETIATTLLTAKLVP